MEEFAQYNHSTVENNVPFNSYHDYNSYCDWSFTEEQVDFYSFFLLNTWKIRFEISIILIF